jgi:hypothetical protein
VKSTLRIDFVTSVGLPHSAISLEARYFVRVSTLQSLDFERRSSLNEIREKPLTRTGQAYLSVLSFLKVIPASY